MPTLPPLVPHRRVPTLTTAVLQVIITGFLLFSLGLGTVFGVNALVHPRVSQGIAIQSTGQAVAQGGAALGLAFLVALDLILLVGTWLRWWWVYYLLILVGGLSVLGAIVDGMDWADVQAVIASSPEEVGLNLMRTPAEIALSFAQSCGYILIAAWMVLLRRWYGTEWACKEVPDPEPGR